MSEFTRRLPHRPSLEQLRKQAKELLRQFRLGDASARKRFDAYSAWADPDHGQRSTLAFAQFILAREYGFASWAELKRQVEALRHPRLPFYRFDKGKNRIEPRPPLSAEDWDGVFAVMKEKGITGLRAPGQMSNAVLERLAKLNHVTSLDLGRSNGVTDGGLASLARMPQLQHLDLSGCTITDRGLEVLRDLPQLETFKLCHYGGVTDAGLPALASLPLLREITLEGMPEVTREGATVLPSRVDVRF